MLATIDEETFCHELSLRYLACERQKDVDAINFGQSRLVDGIKRLSL
ncbi:hypothetical protein [Rhodopirellula bahusiensis]|nr:hypothetical protein [Rhodopirellula bahusiensis]